MGLAHSGSFHTESVYSSRGENLEKKLSCIQKAREWISNAFGSSHYMHHNDIYMLQNHGTSLMLSLPKRLCQPSTTPMPD